MMTMVKHSKAIFIFYDLEENTYYVATLFHDDLEDLPLRLLRRAKRIGDVFYIKVRSLREAKNVFDELYLYSKFRFKERRGRRYLTRDYVQNMIERAERMFLNVSK